MQRNHMVIFCLLSFIGLNPIGDAQGSGSDSSFIVGCGNEHTEKRIIPFFNQIDISGTYQCTIVCGKKQAVEITCDKNILPLITTEVKNRTLIIASKRSFRTENDLKLKIEIPDLNKLTSSGSSDLNISGMNTQFLSIVLDGANEIRIEGKTDHLKANLLGANDLDAMALKSHSVSIVMDGTGNAKVYADRVLNVNIRGSGDIIYDGHPEKIKKEIDGVGEVVKHP